MRSVKAVERRTGWTLSAAAAAIFVVFWVAPLLVLLVLSFTDYDMSANAEFVGLANYRRLFTSPDFWNSLQVTVVFTLLAVGPTLLLALLLALPLARPGRVSLVVRSLVFVPAVLPLVATSLLWLVAFQTDGLMDNVAALFGLPNQPWLSDPTYALGSLLFMVIWKHVGLYVVIFVGGLRAIPQNLYEAAALDGSKAVRTFLFITVPQLRRTFLFVIVVGVTGAVQAFVPAYLLTKGGPVQATEVLPLYMFHNAFGYFRFGYASAISLVLLALLLAFAALQFKLVDEAED